MYNYLILKTNKIEVRTGMRNPSPEIVKSCENAVYGRLRAPDCHLSLAWGKWMLECTQGRAKKMVLWHALADWADRGGLLPPVSRVLLTG